MFNGWQLWVHHSSAKLKSSLPVRKTASSAFASFSSHGGKVKRVRQDHRPQTTDHRPKTTKGGLNHRIFATSTFALYALVRKGQRSSCQQRSSCDDPAGFDATRSDALRVFPACGIAGSQKMYADAVFCLGGAPVVMLSPGFDGLMFLFLNDF